MKTKPRNPYTMRAVKYYVSKNVGVTDIARLLGITRGAVNQCIARYQLKYPVVKPYKKMSTMVTK